jgi:hypothetical protein
VPRRSHSERALKDVRDLTKPIQEELEKFFIATDELEDKKLNIIGWKGPKARVQAIKDAAKSFAKDDALSDESGRLACWRAAGFGEAGPDASCATSVIARLQALR